MKQQFMRALNGEAKYPIVCENGLSILRIVYAEKSSGSGRIVEL
jgi:hypothetical protein